MFLGLTFIELKQNIPSVFEPIFVCLQALVFVPFRANIKETFVESYNIISI